MLAADSIVVRGGSKAVNEPAKLQAINDMIIGSVGLAEEGVLMTQFAKTHKPETATERDVTGFMLEFRKWKKDYSDDKFAGAYLIAYGGKLFYIECMYVIEVKDYFSIGYGRDYGNAAMYLGHSPREAVKVACDLCCFVAEPIVEETMMRAGT